MRVLLFVMFATLAAPAWARVPEAPAELDRRAYRQWLRTIGSTISPFHEQMFHWLDEEQSRPLPREVNADPDRLYISVDRPIAETDELERAGEIERGVTYGLESYAIVPASVDHVLETILFRWGKPVGEAEGTTYPPDSLFGFRQETLTKHWGENSYRTVTVRTNGGIAKDQNDIFSLLVREDGRGGYLVAGNFFGPNGKTTTTSFLTIMMLRPLPGGETELRMSGRHLGQSYNTFGIEIGRRQFGFNPSKIREGQMEFLSQVAELKKTGRITERRPRQAGNSGFSSNL
jgi:hypothetical protein